MCVETFIGLVLLGTVTVGYLVSRALACVNWPMVYYKMCGGK
jgi:hypothetical protein